MSSSSATGASSRSPSPATPDASDDLAHVLIPGEEYSWLSSSPVSRSSTWAAKPEQYAGAQKTVPTLSLQDLIQDSALEDSISPTDSLTRTLFSDSSAYGASSSFFSDVGMLQQHMQVAQLPESSQAPASEGNPPPHPIVYPPKSVCQNLPIIMPSIPTSGTKSRVETQIRLVFDLASAEPFVEGADYNRVGSWKWIKLPKGTSTKKRARKAAKIEPSPDDVLALSVEVTCASPPFTPVLSCATCQAREAKRLARKIAARVRPPRSDSDDAMDEDSQAPKGEDTSSIVQFNCPELAEFSTGSTMLPLRITCYCRHHREKVGFRVTFTLRDQVGRVVGTGTTPPIMITDDHKTGNPAKKKTNEPVFTVVGGQKDKSGPLRMRAKPYEVVRPSSGKASMKTSPSSSTLPSLPHTRAPSPADFTQSALWMQAMSGSDWGSLPAPGNTPSPSSLLNQSLTLPASPSTSILDHDGTSIPPLALAIPPSATTMVPPLTFFPGAGSTAFLTLPTPVIHRIVPAKGPTSGGTEVTILGSNFQSSADIKCVFGDVVAASTQRWSDNTLVCIVPPRLTPGVVPVWIEGYTVAPDNAAVAHFTYEDENDRALMELALQVLGLKLTGKVEDAKNVALRIVGNSSVPDGNPSVDASNLMQLSGGPHMQATVMKVLSVLDVSVTGASPVRTSDVISMQTSSGQSLLHLAVLLDFIDVVDFLLDHRIDVDLRDKNGYTALHFAAVTRSVACTRRLLAATADTDIVDARGRTAQDIAPKHFFRGLRIGYHTASSRALCEEEAEMGDNEDDSDGERIVRTKRRARRKSSTLFTESTRESDQDTVVPAPSPVARDPTRPEPVDEKSSLTAYAEVLQRTLAQLSTDKLSFATVPQMLVPFIPGMPWAQLPQMQMPVFPVLVPTPAWPAFLDKRTPSSDGSEGATRAGASSSVATAMKTAQEWLAVWEKIRALSTPTLVYGPEVEQSPPPVYTPRVPGNVPESPIAESVMTSPPSIFTASLERQERPSVRAQDSTDCVPPAQTVVTRRRQAGKLVQKQDRMLFLFWLPMLFAGFLWACFTAMGVALQGARTMVELKTGIRL